jgi:hypothetical protein
MIFILGYPSLIHDTVAKMKQLERVLSTKSFPKTTAKAYKPSIWSLQGLGKPMSSAW